MYHHYLGSRNSFKQFIDYLMLLKNAHINPSEIVERLKEFGTYRYARGIMWIMKNILGLEEEKLLLEPDVKEGTRILHQSFYYGRFSTGKLNKIIEMMSLNLRLLPYYPSEILLGPLYLLWHQFWKLKMKLLISR